MRSTSRLAFAISTGVTFAVFSCGSDSGNGGGDGPPPGADDAGIADATDGDASQEVDAADAGKPTGPEARWTWRAPLPQGDPVERLFAYQGALYAFTEAWTLWRSTDDGATWSVWSAISSQLGADLPGWAHYMDVGPHGTFYAVGENGVIAKSVDGGRTFNVLRSSFGVTFTTVLAHTDDDVFAGSPSLGLLHSTDGGANWSQVALTNSWPSALASAGPDDVLIGYNSGEIYRSADGGRTFARKRAAGGASAIVRFAALGSERFAAVNFGLLASNDRGETWQEAVLPAAAGHPTLLDVWAGQEEVWAVGASGKILRRPRGSTTFESIARSETTPLTAIAAAASNKLVISGMYGELLRADPAAKVNPVTPLVSPSDYVVTDLVYTSRGHLLATTSKGRILRSDDGAQSFTSTAPSTKWLAAIATPTADEVYVSGWDSVVLRSTDGGRNFTKLPAPTLNAERLGKIWASADGHVFVRQPGSDVVHVSNDHGQTWSAHQLSGLSGAPANGVWGDGVGTVWAGGGNALWKSVDWGSNWTRASDYTSAAIVAVWGASANDIYFTTEGRTIGHTSDGGQHWTLTTSAGGPNVFGALEGIWSSSPDDVYIVGARGLVLHSTDHGTTWLREDATTMGTLLAISGSSAKEIGAVGLYGGMLTRR